MAMRGTEALSGIVSGQLREAKTYRTLWEWADERRYVAANASARPGPWRTSDVPYLRGILEALSFTHPCERVTVIKGNQLGATEGLVINSIGGTIDSWPGPILLVLPREEDVIEYVKTRLQPALAATPTVWAKLGTALGEADGAMRESFLTFPGGQLFVQGSKAPVREKPISLAIIDDADAAQRNAEGDIVELAAKRLVTFVRRKLLVISTPTLAGSSLIDREYQLSSQNRYHIPCPRCGAFAPLEWEHLVWRESSSDVRYRCGLCADEWAEERKLAAMRHGIWVAGNPEMTGHHEGFHVSALYSPFRRWHEIVHDFLVARRALTEDGDPSKMQVHLNCDLGKVYVLPEQVRLQGIELETWKRSRDERPFDRRVLPIELVTVGADVQANRIEATAWAWGKGMECWRLEHAVWKGSPESTEPYDELAAFARRHQARAVGLDTSAFTQQVEDEIRRLWPALLQGLCCLWGIKGIPGLGSIWPRDIRPGETVSVRVDTVKDQIFGALERVSSPGPQYIHLSSEITQPWLSQLFSERPATLRDRTRARYVKVDGRRRNEALDCAVYARAVVYGLIALEPRLAGTLLDAVRPPGDPGGHSPRGRGRPSPGARRRSWMR
jgi:phage terminase large subunit GpA-like protein